jgi:UDP:flavonoid glycosyltransferase YjiC (YdhE family)
LCGAGFETPAEALYLHKKLMVIPMKGQYEQQCNAAALQQMGIPVVKSLKEKHSAKIKEWIRSKQAVKVNYADITKEIIDLVIMNNPTAVFHATASVSSFKRFKNILLSKVLAQFAR